MKTRYIIAIFLVGAAVTIVGALFKIMHWPSASEILITSTILEVIALVLMIWKVLTIDDFNDLLNS